MENRYLVSESELIDFLAAYHYDNCLDIEGVSWYMPNKKEYLGDFDSFEEKTKDELQYYTKIEV